VKRSGLQPPWDRLHALGAFNTILNMGIAAAKVALILSFFMKLTSSSALICLASLPGLFWLVFMFARTAG
jgi:caa(3)-type oxidase subunit IV